MHVGIDGCVMGMNTGGEVVQILPLVYMRSVFM